LKGGRSKYESVEQNTAAVGNEYKRILPEDLLRRYIERCNLSETGPWVNF